MISFDGTDKLNTKILCETNSPQSAKSEYVGNRGVNLIRDNVFTSFASLGSGTLYYQVFKEENL